MGLIDLFIWTNDYIYILIRVLVVMAFVDPNEIVKSNEFSPTKNVPVSYLTIKASIILVENVWDKVSKI